MIRARRSSGPADHPERALAPQGTLKPKPVLTVVASKVWGLDALAPEPHWFRRQTPLTTTSTPSAKTLAVAEVVFTDAGRVALAGSLAGYRGLTRDAYALDLRQFVSWCEQHGLRFFSVRRSDIEL